MEMLFAKPTATFEADPVCVEACKAGGVYGVMATDTDFIALVATAQQMPVYDGQELIYIQLDTMMVRAHLLLLLPSLPAHPPAWSR